MILYYRFLDLVIWFWINFSAFRYQLYSQANDKIDAKCIPPCQDALKHHLRRTNYQSAIWNRSLEQYPMILNPVGVGWERGNDGKLEIKWTSLLPAPEEILDLLSCDCRRECKMETCICLKNNLNCADACHSFICDNSHNSEDDYYSNDEDDDI